MNPVEATRENIQGAVNIINEIFGLHPVNIARQLHPNQKLKWTAADKKGFLDLIQVLSDQVGSRLLVERISLLVQQLPDNHQYVLRERYGLESGKVRTFEDLARSVGVSSTRVKQLDFRAICSIRPIFTESDRTLIGSNRYAFTMPSLLSGLDRRYLSSHYQLTFFPYNQGFFVPIITK